MSRTRFDRLIAAAAVAIAALSTAPAQAADPFTSIFVFGDSLSDAGNNAAAGLYNPGQVVTGNSYVPSFTYASKTYSNGAVWASYLANLLNLPLGPSLLGGNDFAFGGAVTGFPPPGPDAFPYSLTTQMQMYLGATGGVASSTALYVVAGGGNNARAALGAVQGGADLATTAASAAASFASDVGNIVDALEAAGARHILVWDTPNLGAAPAVQAGGAGAIFAGSFLAAQMNLALAARLAGDTDVTTFDLYGFGSSIAANPGAFGFTNATDACGAAAAGTDCNSYVYWDGIHPTTAGHLAIAGAVAVALGVPEPETWALMALGLMALGWHVRHRRLPLA
jgi:outer membrane lipase/esterase